MSTPYEQVKFQGIDQDEWNQFVDEQESAWLFHRAEYQSAMETWPGRENSSFAVLDHGSGDRLVAIVPLLLESQKAGGVYPVRTLISPAGPALVDDLGDRHQRKIYRFIRRVLVERANRQNAQKIVLKQSPLAPAFRGEDCPRVTPLVHLGGSNRSTQTWIVDLSDDEDALWERMEGRARTDVRNARDDGVVVQPQEETSEGVEDYYQLHLETYRRTGADPHPRAYFEVIWDQFLEKNLASVLFAYHENDLVGALNLAQYKKAGKYWTGASSKTGLTMSANSFLQWTAIEKLHSEDARWYETGEAFPGATDDKKKGLNRFKKSFGGELFPFYKNEIAIAPVRDNLYQLLRSLLG